MLCNYCGDLADTKDHQTPKTITKSGFGARIVPACRDCNCKILVDTPVYDDIGRGKIVANTLRRRLINLGSPKWDESEARQELSGNLLKTVLADLKNREVLKARTLHASALFMPYKPNTDVLGPIVSVDVLDLEDPENDDEFT